MAKTVICIATPLYAPDIGGPATHVALLERSLPRDAFELRVVKFSDVRHLPKILRHMVYMSKLIRAAKTAQCIYALDPISVGFPATIVANMLRKPLVLRVGGDYAWEQGVQRFGVTETLDEFVRHEQGSFPVRLLQSLQSYVARRARAVVAPSRYLGKIVETWGVPASRINVIYSQPEFTGGILSRSEARKKLNIREDEEIILSAGRLVPWKGFAGVIDATARILAERPVRLVVAGDGPARTELEAHITSTRAEKFVTLLGSIPQKELMVWLAAADMLVLNTKYEGLSHLLLEVFITQTPVITTSVGGNTELVEHEKTGLLVPYDDIDALEASIRRLLLDRRFAAGLAQNAAASLERFNKDKAVEQISELFQNI